MRPENKWKHIPQSDDALKKIAKDLYNNEIFSNLHLNEYESLESHFMCMLFTCPEQPTKPTKRFKNEDDDIVYIRDKKIYDLTQLDSDLEQYEKDMIDYPFKLEYYKAWTEDIGFIYEYYSSNQSPMSINGKPVFFSMRILTKDDTKKMLDFYNQYKEIREKADNF